MVSGTDGYVEIAGGSAPYPGVPLAGQANALAITRARFDADLERFAAFDRSFAVADMTS